jgi:hypothetical protein
MVDDPADVDLLRFTSEQPARIAGRQRRYLVPLAALTVLALALGGAYYYLRAPTDTPAAPAPAARVEPSQRDREEAISLPPLDQTDALVRELVERLSSHPVIAAWLTTDGLIVNFAAVTTRVANRESVAQELRMIGPVAPFRPRASREDLFVDPSSYQRYDRYAGAVSSVDARGAARLYGTLKPRIDDAFRRISPEGEFDSVMRRAIVELLSVPIVDGEIELVPHGIVYGFADPRLQALSPAQKHLLRMGPRNTQAIQSKLRDIADYLAIPASVLPPVSR